MAIETKNVSFKVDRAELDRLMKRLSLLPEELQNKAGKAAIRKALKHFAEGTRSKLPVKSGALRGSVRTAVKVKPESIWGAVRVRSPLAHLMEYGWMLTKGKHVQRQIRRIDSIPPGGALRSSLNENKERAREEFVQALKTSLNKLESKG